MGRTALHQTLAEEAARWQEAGLDREVVAPVPAGVDFTSNDTLGLTRHPELVAAAEAALQAHGVGGRSARLLGGGSPLDEVAESAVADWLGAERALLFPTGYHANLGVVGALVGPGDVVVSDELNHASLIDAARLSRARVLVYRHGDWQEAERLLASAAGASRRLVVTESVFSMEGDLAPLGPLADACVRQGASLVIDEAHAVGVLGPDGAGGWAALSPDQERRSVLAARVVTGGKALGVMGAFAVGADAVVEHVRQRARTFMFTTAPSPAVSGALVAAVGLARRAEQERSRLRDHAQRIADGLGLPVSPAAVVSYLVGPSGDAMALASQLREAGMHVRAVRPPTVPPGTSRLRIALHAFNTADEVERLVEVLRTSADSQTVPVQAATTARAESLLVTGTDTGIGKTVVSALLLRAASARGVAGYCKPVQTGDDDDAAEVRQLAGVSDAQAPPPHYRFALPASPHEAAAAEGRSIDLEALDSGLDQRLVELGQGILLVELAGGLQVPLVGAFTQIDWLAKRRPPCVLVARSGLGTLNHSLLSVEALRQRHIEPRALFLVGAAHPSNRDTLARMTGLPVYEVPMFDPLDAAALQSWLGDHDLSPVFA
ncbi:MAG: dethiobiotin synthase [Planctomycetota bacterium]|nr:dethiobiotin synthase [Planctomycetota bacterium]